ncbi:unnamed protein product [Brassicogethes aeneus]|uniref:Mediator of RNA polymerase II transcription subunit 1 n=1 Tax=Brassicogethes aeneus TaxID=1431903 RepID=A0A9P0FNP3_BRAAE|nr:unnamed protein product [Brassicogethes aeneus]
MNRVSNGNSTMSNALKEKSKDWQLEILMEKLRSKATQFKTLPEISKNVRMAMLDKRYALDSVDKSQHQKCLDTLQHSIKVTSLQSMIERLESLTRQLGLKFVVEASGVFISSDMFYLEIVLDASGTVKDVKIHHEGKMEQQSCMELVNCLSSGDFDDFTAQLEGFTSIYQLNAEKKVKCKAFTALESLEADLTTLAQLQVFMKEPFNLIHKSPVGILEKRRGGHPMRLTYFVSPYELLNVERGDMDAISVENVVSKNMGYSVTVCMEGAAAHKLQTSTLITVNRSLNGKNTPSNSPLTNQNSTVIPACFVLKLNKPMPMCISLVRKIQQISQWTDIDNQPTQPLLNLIVQHSSDGQMECSNSKGLFVTLPDQNHCYFMTDNKSMEGVLVGSIPFTHPAHVANILMILREQALFNTIISSCVRPKSRQDFDNMTMFEVSALSPTHISISLEHPLEESMSTAEMDLTDISALCCRIHHPGTPPPANAPDVASDLSTRILNRCFSIPITMRSVIKLWEGQSQRKSIYNGHENFSLPLGSVDPGGSGGGGGNAGPASGNSAAAGPLSEFGGLSSGGGNAGTSATSSGGGVAAFTKIKEEPGLLGGQGGSLLGASMHQSGFLNDVVISQTNFSNFPPSEGVLSNLELATGGDKPPKRQKRKATDEPWKASSNASAKKRVGATTSTESSANAELMTESSSSCDSTSRSTPISQETDPTLATANCDSPPSGFPSDLELEKPDDDFDVGDEPKPTSFRDDSDRSGPDEKPTLASGLSIIPIPPSSGAGGFNPAADKRTADIEIIPLLPSSITITPISATAGSASKGNDEGRGSGSREKDKEKKGQKGGGKDDKGRLEKKKKKKRDGSPMGPPEKVPVKSDTLPKPITESPPQNSPTPNSPNMLRKFAQSPTNSRPISLSGKLSPNLVKTSLKPSSSPKHSPLHMSSSPKHISGIGSPKHGSSPKHGGTSSGKPSMSALKNAANSPSSKNPDKKSVSDKSRDKDKSGKSIFSKSVKSGVKVKPLDLNATESMQDDVLANALDPKLNPNLNRNRKGSLSAIVDKLKVNAQHCDTTVDLSQKSTKSEKDRTSSNKIDPSKPLVKLGEPKNSEYMVKSSSEGIKITINKTRGKESKNSGTKSSSSSNSSSGTGSPKIHTGLKPGVNSGPASKKSLTKDPFPKNNQQTTTNSNVLNSQSQKASSATIKNHYNVASQSNSAKMTSTSSSKSVSKSTGSPKMGSSGSGDFNRSKDRAKSSLSKSGSEKSIFSIKDRGKGSPTPGGKDDDVFKMGQANPYTPMLMEGMMKQLDKNFQIPKLSARSSEEKKSSSLPKEPTNNLANNSVARNAIESAKIFDVALPKYPLTIPSKMFENAMDQQQKRNNVNINLNIGASGLKADDIDEKKKEIGPSLSTSQGASN